MAGRDPAIHALTPAPQNPPQLTARAASLPELSGPSWRILEGALTLGLARATGAAASFIAVPLTLSYLGPERYGAWLAIVSLLAWASLTDFGLANGFANALTQAAARNDAALLRTHLANGFLVLSALAGLAGGAIFLIGPKIPWAALFGLTSPRAAAELPAALAAATIIFLLTLPLTIGQKLYLACGEGKCANAWSAAGSVISLLALLMVTRAQGGLVRLVIAVSGAGLLVNAASLAALLRRRPQLRPAAADMALARLPDTLNASGKFFIIQILSLAVFETDNLLVGHVLGAASIPAYSLTYTLFTYTSLPQNLAFSYLWTAYTDAIARRDTLWLRKTLVRTTIAGLAFTAVAAAALIFIAPPFIRWWTDGAVAPHQPLILWLAGWSLIHAATNPLACLLAAASRLTWQILYSAAAALTNIPLSILLLHQWGIQGAIAGTVISYAVFILIPIQLDTRALLKALAAA
jgi:O-antigen/teichoic acid export membrane protein